MKHIFIIILILVTIPSISQTGDLGSLSEDTNLVNKLNREATVLKSSKPIASYQLSKRAILLSEKLNYKKGKFKALLNLIVYYNISKQTDSCDLLCRLAINLCNETNNNYFRKELFQLQGGMMYYKGYADSSLVYYLKSLKLNEDLKDSLGISNALMGLSIVYSNTDKKRQLEYIDKAIALKFRFKDTLGLIKAYSFKAIYYRSENVDSSLKYGRFALNQNLKTQNLIERASLFNELGTFYMMKNSCDSAIMNTLKALKIYEKLNFVDVLSDTKITLANYYFNCDKISAAETLALDVYTIVSKNDDEEGLRRSSEILASIYAKKQDFKNAYNFFKINVQYTDSVNIKINKQQILDVSTKYETEKKDAEIQLLNKDKLIAKSESKKEQQIKFFIIAIAVFLLLIAAILYHNYKKKLNANIQLNEQKQLIEQKNVLLQNQADLINDSIEYAKKTQDSMLPNTNVLQGFVSDFFIYYKPKDIISGDFYWMYKNENRVVIAAADCTGHGVPGALMSVMGHNALDSAYRELENCSPPNVISYLDKFIKNKTIGEGNASANVDGMAISIIELLKDAKKINYSSAKQPIYIIQAGELIELKANSFSVGSLQNQSVTGGEFQLQSGDCIYLFSDGYVDQKGGQDKRKFMSAKFKQLLIQIVEKSSAQQKEIISSTMEAWKGNNTQIDDMLIIGLKI